MWTAARDWPGETVFVLAGGPSVLDLDLSLLEGRRVIAVNSAWRSYPAADILFFADGRWWKQAEFRPRDFAGLVVTTAAEIGDPRVMKLKKVVPGGLSDRPDSVALRRSSVTGAINLALHYGAKQIVLLGVDGKLGADGRRHNHGDRYPWPLKPGCFDEHRAEFESVAASAIKAGVTIVNANPDSAIDVWPKMSFEECLAMTSSQTEKPAAPSASRSKRGDATSGAVRVFVGTAANGEDAESQAVLEWSIRKHASLPVEIVWMMHSHDPQDFWSGFDSSNWKTPFSGFRWAVPAACNYEGRAIYMDSDVIVMADIAELWRQDFKGKAVLAKHGGRLCVSLWDCAAAKQHVLPLDQLRSNPQQHGIMQGRSRQGNFLGVFEGEWNCLDGEGFADLSDPRLKAIHYTEMSCQPHLDRAIARLAAAGQKHWMDGKRYPHPRRDLQALFDRMLAEAEENGFTVAGYLPEKPYGAYRKASLAHYGAAGPARIRARGKR